MLPPDSPFHPVDPDRIILETRDAVAFLDKYPVSEGHTLVVPKIAVITLGELAPEVEAGLWKAVRQVRDLLEEQYWPDGFNIGVNDGRAAGQTIPHAHIHVIPRYAGDVPDPRGGIRWVVPERAKYWS
jgi:diadenosine tetraphosphate (Ap4A) HIT family hydrolase